MVRGTLKTTGVRQSLIRSKPIRLVKTRSAAKKPKTGARLRRSITPGTVLILVAGRFRGKRVVFLKQLPSGLLLITGPYRLNGVPLQRVNQAFVIATSTKINISAVSIPDSLTDDLFVKPKAKKSRKILAESPAGAEKTPLSAERLALQKNVDAQLKPVIGAVPLLKAYLCAVFSLSKGQAPHTLKF